MISEWQEFLAANKAELNKDRVASAPHTQPLFEDINANILCDLSEVGLIGVFGKESADFLQRQLINDVSQVTPTHSQLNAYCNPKGRMLAIFRIFMRDDIFYLRIPVGVLRPTLERLRMFVLRAEVTLEDVSDRLVRIGLAGPTAEDLLSAMVDKVPSEPDDCISQNGVTMLRVPGPHPRFELYGEVDAMKPVWATLDCNTRTVDTSVWSLLDIFAGIPTVLEQTVEAFVPQMTNLDLIGGVSFDKGCYPGQEIVARTHYLGKVKRRMFRCHANTDHTPLPGTVVNASAQPQGPALGTIVDAQPNPKGGVEALAVLQLADLETGVLRLDGADKPPIEIKALPYEVFTST